MPVNGWRGILTSAPQPAVSATWLASIHPGGVGGGLRLGLQCWTARWRCWGEAALADGGVLRFTGSAVVAGNSRFFAHHLIEIGDDALISWDVTLRDADGHTILQGPSSALSRRCASVAMSGSGRAWTSCPAAKLARGLWWARSLVKGEVPPHALVAGVPQRILRSDIEWRA
ncbi:hypothetical protein [Candidatus Amarolinea dominans]|uniref:hypothetical protein n=1 Tax=Candidatus Amarolinea dominans TaxID=3140696 RepID=UPI0031CCD962